MNYGKIYICTDSWQTGTDILKYEDETAYFNLFGESCKCNLVTPVVYHDVNGEWKPFEKAENVTDVMTPEIVVRGKQRMH